MRKLKNGSTFIEGVQSVISTYNNGVKLIIITDKKGDSISIAEESLNIIFNFIDTDGYDSKDNKDSKINSNIYDELFNIINRRK